VLMCWCVNVLDFLITDVMVCWCDVLTRVVGIDPETV
jgi:hypothetical protein